jgi:hypothetical protein
MEAEEAKIEKLKIWVTCNKCNTKYTDTFAPEELGREYATCPLCGNKDNIHLLYLAHAWD